jgi:fumarate hydratase class II
VTATIPVKKAAAEANAALGRLDAAIAGAIVQVADDVLGGRFRVSSSWSTSIRPAPARRTT